MLVYIFISILAVNRRMSYAVAMNMDNTDTGIAWKKQANSVKFRPPPLKFVLRGIISSR